MFAVRFTLLPEGTFTLEAVKVMDVGTGPLPPPPPLVDPPPQPKKARNKIVPQAKVPMAASWLRRRAAIIRRRAASAMTDVTPIGKTRWGGKQYIGGASGGAELVELLADGASVEIVSVDVTAVPLLRLTVAGPKLQETPGGAPPLTGHASVTGLAELLAGVTVMVAIPELPALIDGLEKFAERLKSGMFTLTFRSAPLWK